MSYLSLLFTSALRGMTSTSGAGNVNPLRAFGGLTPPAPDALEKAWIGTRGEPDDFRLPLGIASLEHWLDLNA